MATIKKYNELDPYGEEDWDEHNVKPRPELNMFIQTHQYFQRRGNDMVEQWRDNNHEYKKRIRIWDRKVCDFTEDFPGVDDNLNYPPEAGNLTFLDYYDNFKEIYTCPRCLKKSKNHREHGDGWICGSCGLKSRNWGNSLYVWE